MANGEEKHILRGALRRVSYIFYIAVTFSLIYNVLRLTGPLFMMLIYDRVFSSRSEATLLALFVLVLLLLGIMALLDYSRRRILARFGAQFQERVENDIFDYAAKAEFSSRSGSKPVNGLSELDRLRGFFHSGSLISVLDFAWSPMFFVVVFILNQTLAFIVAGGVLLMALFNFVSFLFGKERQSRFEQASAKIGDLKDTILISRSTIRTHGMTTAYNNRWLDARRDSRDKSVELADWTQWFSTGSTHLAMVLQYSILATGAYFALKGQLSVGAVVACMFLSVRVFYPAERFIKQIPKLRQAHEDWKKLTGILKVQDKASVGEARIEFKPSVTLKTVWVKSPLNKQTLLSSISLAVKPGSVVEIVGKTGSGKTILAETIIGCRQTSAGTILYSGVNADLISSEQADGFFGFVSQVPEFIPGTLEENITGLAQKPDHDEMVEAARIAKIHDAIMELPDGYQTRIPANGDGFSNGQRHRLALARALYGRPGIILIDEPIQTLRDSLGTGLRKSISKFTGTECTMIVLTRKRVPSLGATQHFILQNGKLSSDKPISSGAAKSTGNVINLGGAAKRDVQIETNEKV